MLKRILIFVLIFLSSNSFAVENFDFVVDNFSDVISEFDNEIIDEDYSKMIEEIQKGNFNFKYKKIFGNASKFFIKEVRNNIGIAIQVVFIAILLSLLKSLQSSFSSSGISKIAFYVCYILVITLLLSSFTNIYNIAKDFVIDINKFTNVLTPIIVGLVAATGGITTSTMIYPVIAFFSQFIITFSTKFLLPIAMICFLFNIVNNISENVSVSNISKLLKSFSLWSVGLILTLFVGIVSLEGTVASTVDGVTAKTAKFLFSGGIPVVGKLLGDSVDTILGSTLIIKDTIGFVGIIVLFGLALTPIIKIFATMLIYYITAAVIQPFSDSRIVKSIYGIGEVTSTILVILLTVSVMFIIGTVMLLKITNFTMMYR